jgi:hypothetical protein
MLDQTTISEIKNLTHYNHHCEALQLAAMLIGATRLAQKAQMVAIIRDLDQGLDHNLSKYYYGLHDELFTRVKNLIDTGKLQPEDYDTLKSAL